jgi:hypothetical protein
MTWLPMTILESDVTRRKVRPQIDASRWPNVLHDNPATSCVFSTMEFSDITGAEPIVFIDFQTRPSNAQRSGAHLLPASRTSAITFVRLPGPAWVTDRSLEAASFRPRIESFNAPRQDRRASRNTQGGMRQEREAATSGIHGLSSRGGQVSTSAP